MAKKPANARDERLEKASELLKETFDHVLIVGVTDEGAAGSYAQVKREGFPLLRVATQEALIELEKHFKG